MAIKQKIKGIIGKISDRYYIMRAKSVEIEKYRDSRREKIMAQKPLSNQEKAEIDKFYQENYGGRIPYTWHQYYSAVTGKFDVTYFPELLFIPEFERYMNPYSHYAETFSDKNILPYIAKAAGIEMPKTVISCVFGQYRDCNDQIITAEAAKDIVQNSNFLFAKPSIESCSGEGCMTLDFVNGKEKQTSKSAEEIFVSLGTSFVIQERIQCHDSIAKIYSGSVNTFRIMTYRWKDKIKHLPVIMRIGKGGACVDNAHAGGVFIAIEDDGTLHEWATTEFNDKFTEHPDSHLVFAGYQIPLVKDVIAAAYRMHNMIPQVGAINWDFSINEEGKPILIEVNINGGSAWLFQMAHGRGAFGDETAEVLQWLRKVKKMNRKEREQHLFGN